jgi:hypothetical protein
MSIAVSAVVRPSKLLLAMVSAACLCVALIAILIGCNQFDIFPVWSGLLLALIYFAGAITCWTLFFFTQKIYLISISSAGQIRLLELDAPTENMLEVFDTGNTAWLVVNLLEDSTLWPQLLLLRLRSETGRVIVLPILSDSVGLHSFKSLSVACRWIAVRINQNDNEIL